MKILIVPIVLFFGLLGCESKRTIEREHHPARKEPENKILESANAQVKPLSPFLTKKKTEENFIKKYKIDAFEVDIHLTGNFGWSSEKEQRTIYTSGYRPPLYIKEEYPGIIHYTKWHRLNKNSDSYSLVTDQLEFYNEQGELITTYAVDESNPYIKQYPDLINHFYNAEGTLVGGDANEIAKRVKFRNCTTNISIDENTGFTGVNYNFFESNESGNVVNFKTTFIVLDSLGNEVNALKDKELFINDSYVTPDGQYLALCTGGMVDINNFGNEVNGHAQYEIHTYNLANMDSLYSRSAPYINGFNGDWFHNDWVIFTISDEYSNDFSEELYFIDLKNGIEYVKLFNKNEWDELSSKFTNPPPGEELKKDILKTFEFSKNHI